MKLPCLRTHPTFCPKSGFSLAEVLVAMGVIALLIVMLFPALKGALASSHTPKCMNNQRQILSAILALAADDRGRLPDIATDTGGADANRWDVRVAEYLDINHSAFYGPDATLLRCPSAEKDAWFTYGLPYASGTRRVFARKQQSADPPAGSPNNMGSQRLVNLPASTILIADAYDPRNPTSDLFYSPWGNYPFTSDQDNDGVNDSSGNLPPPRKFNCIAPRHNGERAFAGGAADGSVKLLTIREWAENPKYWGPAQ